MATTWWSPNAALISEVDTFTITAVATAGTVGVTINTKTVAYTCLSSDTTATAAAALQALLSAQTAPPEFQEIAWTVNGTAITATAIVPGTPFTATTSSSGGATISQSHAQANVSNSDVGNNNNWLRAGSPGIPQNGDDVIVADSTVPLLWNLTALASVQFNSFNRYQSFTGQIGLPEVNANGYVEYRPINFQFTGSGTIPVNLGVNAGVGSGPTRERYDFQSAAVNVNVYASGSPSDPYAVMLLGSGIAVLNVFNTSVGVATLPGSTATVTTATVDGGGSLAFGPGVTTTTITANNGTVATAAVPTTLNAYNGSSVAVSSTGGTITTVSGQNGSQITYNSNTTITSLGLTSGAVFDKSGDNRALTITSGNIDGDTCRVLDPLNTITCTNGYAMHNQTTSGVFTMGTGRLVKIS